MPPHKRKRICHVYEEVKSINDISLIDEELQNIIIEVKQHIDRICRVYIDREFAGFMRKHYQDALDEIEGRNDLISNRNNRFAFIPITLNRYYRDDRSIT